MYMKCVRLLLYAILILTSVISVQAAEYGSFKAYMDYGTISDSSTVQWRLQQSSQTDSHGIRTLDDRYMIAIGTGWSFEVGEIISVSLDSGVTLPCIVGDIKQDKHTDNSNRFTKVGDKTNVIEFIVEVDSLSAKSKEMGDISYSNAVFQGNVLNIEKAHTSTNCVSRLRKY